MTDLDPDILRDDLADAPPLDDFSTWTQYVAVGPLPAPSYHAAADGTPVWLDGGEFEGGWAVGLNPDGTFGAKVYTADGKVTNPSALAMAILAAEREATR